MRPAALSVEYLHTSFPDLVREYRDGEIVERDLPGYSHGKTQETRMRVRPTRFLIPNVAAFHPNEPDALPAAPPLIAIEILSLDDRLGAEAEGPLCAIRRSEVREEYRTWGVPHVWLVDPLSRRFYTCDAGLTETSSLRVPELGIEITPRNLFR